jgi:hypothetical protein
MSGKLSLPQWLHLILELESHSAAPEEESRAVERRPSREEKIERSATSNALEKLSGVNALLLYFLFSTLYFFGLGAKKIGAPKGTC